MRVGQGFDLVVFDCDGVLVDSERIVIEIEARVLTEMGWPITVGEVVARFMGRPSDDVLADIAARLGDERAAEFDRVTTEETLIAFRERLTAIDGIRGLVDALHHAGVATCVASSGSHRKMQLTLGITGLHELFEGRIFSVSDVERGKPAPDLFLHAASTMAVDPNSAAVVEDSVSGVRAARAAGMVCFGYAGGLTPTAVLAEAGAVTFDHMSQLTPRLLPGPVR
ncbi:MAG: HAD family hydrolase [Actinomycetota bacterium]